MEKEKIVIFGTSLFAEIASEYFEHDSEYEVVGFTVHKKFLLKNKIKFGLPVFPFEDISGEGRFIYIAVGYQYMNDTRRTIVVDAMNKGFYLADYISSRAFVWHHDLEFHNFVFENNVIQPFVIIGSNNIFWSSNHIGHHSQIGSHNFFSSHVVLSGNCRVGDNCFFGVNSTIVDNIKIGDRCLIGAGSLVLKDVPNDTIVIGIWK